MGEQERPDERSDSVRHARRIVLKLGTKVLLSHYLSGGKDGKILRLIDDIATYMKKGYEFAIVSSGAVGFGMQLLGLDARPSDLKKKQALASIGQALLMQKWNELFRSHGLNTGQILVTYDIIENRKRFLHTRDCLLTLFRYGAVPIINENDSVSVDELKFGDNDTLSALVSILIDADLLVLFTDTGGLYTGNPKRSAEAQRIGYLDKIDETVYRLVEDRQNAHSLGGMLSKLQAAQRCTQGGASVVIGDGITPDLAGILEGRDIGTFIKADRKFQSKRKRWIYFNSKIRGKIIVDKGAETALLRHGKSLLPGGVTAVEGKFPEGALVGIYNNEQQLIGKGISYYASTDVEKIRGRQSGSILKGEVPRFYQEIVHRDNMVVIKREE
ncbi:MAG: glutamate 5-kinase [Candidatus Marinimicrobia bacterium]|nr:glutamate 5-kinase [Candidatus Neomarinimicrobiota bacterium]